MFHLDNKSGVPVMPPLSDEFSSTELFFTEGGSGVNPSWPGAAWFNIVQSELLNVVKAAGLDPEKHTLNQITTALNKMFLSRVNPGADIKADGKVDEFLANLGLHKSIIDDVALQHKVVHDIDYSSHFVNGDEMSQGFCICDTPDGPRMYIHQPVSTGGVRIVETTFNPAGNNENPEVIAFSQAFMDIGHQSIGGIYENGSVVLYTLTSDGKGVNKIAWKGNATVVADITRTEVFKTGFYDTDTAITLALSNDGSMLLIQTTDQDVHVHYNKDDRRVVYLFDRASLNFKRRIYLENLNMVGGAFQGMASDNHYLFVLYGYTGVFIPQCVAVYNLSTSEKVREFNIDSVRAKYGRGRMLGGGALGYPVLQEPEGLALYNGKLYVLAMDFWNSTADVVEFEGSYFAARAASVLGKSPINSSSWTPTTYNIAGAAAYDSTHTYTTSNPTKRNKAIVSIEADDGTGYPIDSGVAYPGSHASMVLGDNAVNISLPWGNDLQVAAWEQNLLSHRPLYEFRKEAPDTATAATVFRLFGDAFQQGPYSGRYVQFKHRLSPVTDALEMRADVDLLSGGGINLYSMKDSASPGRTRFYCTDGANTYSVLLSPVSPSFHSDQDKIINLGTALNRWGIAHLQGVRVASDDATQKQITIQTTLKQAHFQVSTVGNAGIFDSTANKYLFASRTDGTAFMQMATEIAGQFKPSANNTYDLGDPASAFRNAYLNNSPTVVSDAELKDEPRDATDVENMAFAEIARLPSVWRWLQRIEEEGDEARLHSGPTVQAAIAVMDKYGLDWTMYSAFCHDVWEAREAEFEDVPAIYAEVPVQPAVYSEDGELLSGITTVCVEEAKTIMVRPALEAESRYRFRKEELLWWCQRAFVSQVDTLTSQLEAFGQRLSQLESQ